VNDHQVLVAGIAERLDVAALLESLSDDQLHTPSLCAGWDCFTVGAHLAVTVSVSFAAFTAAVIRHRGSVARANDRLARRMALRPVADVVHLLRISADMQSPTPRERPLAMLTDGLVHAGDIRYPLGLPYDPQHDRVLAALEFLTGGASFDYVGRRGLDGLALVAEDVDFVWGSGGEVFGRGADLMMALCGRTNFLARLDGSGVPLLKARLG
jgi:uncharacterized protein (TIGR03083 family)